MKLTLLVLLSLYASASLSKRFLQDEDEILLGSFQQIDLQNPPSDYLDTLAYLQTQLNSVCHLNSNVQITSVDKAFVQIVAGVNYEIVFNVQNHESEQLTVNIYQCLTENGLSSYDVDYCV